MITTCGDGWTSLDFTSNLYNSKASKQTAEMVLQTNNKLAAQSIRNNNQYYSFIDQAKSDELRVYIWRSNVRVF